MAENENQQLEIRVVKVESAQDHQREVFSDIRKEIGVLRLEVVAVREETHKIEQRVSMIDSRLSLIVAGASIVGGLLSAIASAVLSSFLNKGH